jgi:hypothetical protein
VQVEAQRLLAEIVGRRVVEKTLTMQGLWTWNGAYFGYRDGDELRTYDGRHVGCFSHDDVYGIDGHYLGEVLGTRLITNLAKKSQLYTTFTPQMKRMARIKRKNQTNRLMLIGYEDFPKPDEL